MERTSFYLLLSSIVATALTACGGDDEECPHTVVLGSRERTVDTTSACQSFAVLAGQAAYFAIPKERCAELCADAKMNQCTLPIGYMAQFSMLNSAFDAGITRQCPAWLSTIALTCARTEEVGKWNDTCPVAGRRPAGLLAARRREQCELADYLARAAHLEAASVFAFDKLAEDLARLSAPHALIEACLLAARQETKHARVVGKLARARGARPRGVDLAVQRPSTLLELALENAVEGVVRESYGALQANFSARTARDPEMRRAMAAIAVDEASHAWLARRIAAWLEPRLSEAERAQVAQAKAATISALRSELEDEPTRALSGELGVPSRAEALHLFTALLQQVWQPGSVSA